MPATAVEAAQEMATAQAVITAAAAADAERIWRTLDPAALGESFRAVHGQLVGAVTAGQLLAAESPARYIAAALQAQGIDAPAEGLPIVHELAGIASDGRPLDTLLTQPIIETLQTIKLGGTPAQGMASGLLTLTRIAATQTADAGRGAAGLNIAARPGVKTYVRMIQPPACARCVILAGVTYKALTPFARHPCCKCLHIPTAENAAGDLRTDPHEYLQSIDRTELDRILGKAGADAYAAGGDLNQIVNARRGVTSMTAYGRKVKVTLDGTTQRGFWNARERARLIRDGKVPESVRRQGSRHVQLATPRLMPEECYRLAAGDRDEAIRLLQRFGWLTGHPAPRPIVPRPAPAPRPPPRPRPVPEPAAPPTPTDPLAGLDLAAMNDDDLAELMGQVADDEAATDRLLAEFERRDATDPVDVPELAPAADVDDLDDTPENRRIDELLARGYNYRDAYAEAHGLDEAALAQQERLALIDGERQAGETREQAVRRLYDEEVHRLWLQAEGDTRGNLLTREGQHAGINPIELFSGTSARARKYASEELKRWWEANGGRQTFTQYKAQALGREADKKAAAASALQGNGRDFGI